MNNGEISLESVFLDWRDTFERESGRPALLFDAFKGGFNQGIVFAGGEAENDE